MSTLSLLLALPACPILDKISSLPAPAASFLSTADIARKALPRPTPESHVFGESPASTFAKMNLWLASGVARTRTCDEWAHHELDNAARVLYRQRIPDLHTEYKERGDRRALHFEEFEHKERLWKAEAVATTKLASHAPGGLVYNTTRDGKCAEIIMWWVHHLSETQRAQIAAIEEFVLPLMPADVAPHGAVHRTVEYDQQVGCTSCHVAIHVPGAPPITPIPNKTSPVQYPTTCPDDPDTGKPTVWYNRTKRCDWDYVPACQPCEGIGGMVWGNQEDEWIPMPCEMVAMPEDIPSDNLTSPLWPKDFSVDEKALLTFPGRDPCDVSFRNSTYTLYFQTTADGPIYHTKGHSGPSGPSPAPGSSWALPNGNFYNTVDVNENPVFCICLSNADPVVDNAVTGPLVYDFNADAKLIGRERVKPEYLSDEFILADHWAKGPHHFWIDVKTNLMLREWQPFNGLQTYYNWNVSTPSPSVINVPEICYKGFLNQNVTCIADPPSAPVRATA